MALFKIFKDKSGEYRVFIKLKNRIEFISISRESRQDCFELIKSIKSASISEVSYHMHSSDCGSVYFSLKDRANKLVLGDSISYINLPTLRGKILLMKKSVSKAKVDVEEYTI